MMGDFRVIEDDQRHFTNGTPPDYMTGCVVKLACTEILDGHSPNDPEYGILKSMTKGAHVTVVEVRELLPVGWSPVYQVVVERNGSQTVLWERLVKEV